MKRLALFTLILGAALALLPVASAAVRLDDGTSGSVAVVAPITDTATQAVVLRSKGVAAYYANAGAGIDPAIQAVLLRNKLAAEHANPLTATATVPLTGKALADFYDTGAVTTSHPTAPLTGKALADYYDTGAVAQPTDPLGTSTLSSTTGSGDSIEINWNALIGAILLTVLLIGTAGAAINRRRHQPSF